MIHINLLPVREARRRADIKQQAMLLAAAISVTVIALGYVHFSLNQNIRSTRQQVERTQAQIKQFKPQIRQVEAYKKKKRQIQRKLDVIVGLDRSRSGPVRVLDELATHTPDRLWLTKLSANGNKLTLTGKSLDNEVVALFLTHLNNSPYFRNVELKKTELQSKGGIKVHAFQLNARIVDPYAPKARDEGAKTSASKGKKRARAGGAASVGR